MKRTAIVVSHTHWDREWYRPFQEFRMQLVDLVDDLLDLLAGDADFKHFVLDGQSIILDDYVEVRPERRSELAKHIRDGRISVGPWYTLPDEALVSGEALIRNLIAGQRSAEPFGPVMQVGYLPDTFGHVNQLPQIVRGWGLKAAVVTRGVPDNPCEFLWDGPDGVPVLTINLRHSYGNAVYLYPGQGLVPRIKELVQRLAPYATTPYLLFMITRQLRLLVQSKELSMQRCRRADIKSRLGISKDFILDKALEQGRNYSMERLEHVYRQLLETDRAIKRGLMKGEMALELLIADLCA